MNKAKAFFFDLDGCVYYSDRLAEGAAELIQRLRESGKYVYFITNNSRQTPDEIAAKLRGMGLPVPPIDIISATEVTGKYVLGRYGSSLIKVAGSKSLSSALAQFGHKVLPLQSTEPANVVVVGRDIDFTYEKLALIAREVERGARVVSTNCDLFHPGSEGERVPETGALIAAIQAVTGAEVEYVGKPEPHLFLFGMQACGVNPEESVMVGDNYDTDITGGKRAGMFTVWLAGRAHNFTREAKPNADLIVENIASLNNQL